MAQLTELNLNTFVRGDSSVLRWSWVKQEAGGGTTPLSLVGYKVALTVKTSQYDSSVDDSTAVQGSDNVLFKIDVDCDNPEDMHGIDPTLGQIVFPLSKKATWIAPGTYYIDIVVENKSSHRTQTVMYGKLNIQGHPTNRLTTDETDTFEDLGV